MITKDTVQNYSKYDIFNQLEIEREKVGVLVAERFKLHESRYMLNKELEADKIENKELRGLIKKFIEQAEHINEMFGQIESNNSLIYEAEQALNKER